MRRELILAHLMAMRSAVDALILELGDGDERRCCAQPQIQEVETYGGKQSHCMNCDAWFQSGTDKVSGEDSQSDKVRGG